jgi:taurine dioxygenase
VITTRPLSDALGCEMRGVDLGAGIGDAEFAAVEQALDDHAVVVLPGQTLTPQAFASFARRFGRPEPHVIDQFHHPEDPNILILSNVQHRGRPIGLADGGTYFHSDYSYLEVPARCTLLFAIQLPDEGNAGTLFANQRRAWEDLPGDRQAAIDGLVCRHHYGNRDNLDERSRTAASPLSDAQKSRMSWVRHPLVRRHRRTGEPCLYAVSGSSFAIEGMGDGESTVLLDELKRHATAPRYQYQHPYRVGDVVIWDNCQVLHSAPLADGSRARTLWRITIKDPGPTL